MSRSSIRIEDLPREIPGPEIAGRGVDRRAFLRAMVAAGAGAALAGFLGPERALAQVASAFPDGVKCGDPLPDGAVIWTRIPAPAPPARYGRVLWLVAEDPAFTRIVRGALVLTDTATDHAVHARVRGLQPDRWYYYKFTLSNGATSPVGRLRTAPAPDATPDRLRYAFASCQQRGVRGIDGRESLYVTHRAIANEGVDFLMHLGDYIYVSDFGDLTLPLYRRRWRIFHSNPLLQELQAQVPLVAMWDDGEFYNGVDRTGDPARLQAARQAWFEHMPLLRNAEQRSYRSFAWGRLADVLMIDVRSYRDPEVPANTVLLGTLDAQDSRIPPGEQMFAPGRTTLGAEQKRWLEDALVASRASWRFIGNPYNMSPWKITDLDTPAARAADPNLQRNAGVYVSNEAWDDYQVERRELLEFLAQRDVRNVVFTSGHTHFYLATELQPDFDDAASPTVAFDFVTGSQTADPDPLERAPAFLWKAIEEAFLVENAPYMKHANLLDQGFAVVDVTPEECIVTFRAVDTFDPNAVARTVARFRVVSGSRQLEVLAP
jgi:alkaline phosphatase D